MQTQALAAKLRDPLEPPCTQTGSTEPDISVIQLECLFHACNLVIALETSAAPHAERQGLVKQVDEEPPWLRAVMDTAYSSEAQDDMCR